MNVRLRTTFVSLWLLFIGHTFAQNIGLDLPVINNATPGTSILMPVRVSGFSHIASAQFVFRWDTTVLDFKNVNGFNLPNLDLQDFNSVHALDSGLVRFQWEAPNSYPGVTVADSTIIFRIRFDVIGQINSGSTVYFTQAFPTLFEFTRGLPDGSLVALGLDDAVLHQGFVAVGYTSATHDPVGNALNIKLTPNPVGDHATVTVYLPESSDLTWLITDVVGQVVAQGTESQVPAGQYEMPIDQALFAESGSYFLLARTATHSGVVPFVKF